ncbi:multicopper oxidase domain-containing protein [Skermanella rosea]|uniref:Multicopper oxidase domain-containing protein n=1 Tax=Skermanella cutis TaxID=2775420 RepID=A0ABX7BAN1_9PROT|nr:MULTISPECIES: multicopper oxidase domain-containing protein [Skermanella]QQP89492.1 multicopper oxidase domain-containing protein [Skermanella sp. TT6]UEM03638.1 multicopper oxidase domain-containing protein [Skermanella rosea]
MTIIYRPIFDPLEFDTFGCHPFEDDPATPDRTNRQVFVRRQVADWNVDMKDGSQLQFWGFKDPDISGSDSPWPSKIIRVKQGQIFHCEFKPTKGAHTIHWHGIEPTPMNDGVGHTSFEVKSSYVYQWCAHQAGTYLYHCHKNTVLHFEMGMYGVLIVDPLTKPSDTRNPNYLYDPLPGDLTPGITPGAPYGAESILVFDDVDPVWHKLDHNAGMCGDDVGLDKFNPTYFLINGVHNGLSQIDRRTVTTTQAGKNVLVRLANASYSRLYVTLPVDAWIVEVDGRPLRVNRAKGAFAGPRKLAANTRLEIAVAQRYALWIPNIPRGDHRITGHFHHWITNKRHFDGTAVAKIIAT